MADCSTAWPPHSFVAWLFVASASLGQLAECSAEPRPKRFLVNARGSSVEGPGSEVSCERYD
eukprot:1799776-Alexandrium_andersonii.AAC.1